MKTLTKKPDSSYRQLKTWMNKPQQDFSLPQIPLIEKKLFPEQGKDFRTHKLQQFLLGTFDLSFKAATVFLLFTMLFYTMLVVTWFVFGTPGGNVAGR